MAHDGVHQPCVSDFCELARVLKCELSIVSLEEGDTVATAINVTHFESVWAWDVLIGLSAPSSASQ